MSGLFKFKLGMTNKKTKKYKLTKHNSFLMIYAQSDINNGKLHAIYIILLQRVINNGGPSCIFNRVKQLKSSCLHADGIHRYENKRYHGPDTKIANVKICNSKKKQLRSFGVNANATHSHIFSLSLLWV